jgi:predicted enzyme related to lactoylglutathione lyase
MGKRERYEPGTFCWVELATTDPEGAKAFYTRLFGWEAEDTPIAGGGTYTLLRLDGDDVCALYGMEPERREAGVPPHWFSQVSVDDAAASAVRAEELGGKAHGGALDVMGLGKMAVIEDPQGAVLAAWEPDAHIGAGRVNDPGCLTWNDLQTRDALGAADFYGRLFGWETEIMGETGTPEYVILRNAGRSNGGIMPMTEAHGNASAHWLPYFTVTSADEAVETAKGLGGTVLAGPIDLGAGRIAVLADPQGAHFAVFEGETDD